MGGFPLGYTKSEFYVLSSTGADDFVPLDLTGAREVVFQMDPSSTVSGILTPDTSGNELAQFLLPQAMTTPLVVHSTDGRLYFSALVGGTAKVNVWVIRG